MPFLSESGRTFQPASPQPHSGVYFLLNGLEDLSLQGHCSPPLNPLARHAITHEFQHHLSAKS